MSNNCVYRTTFSDFAAKNSKDTRFKAIEKMKDRETLFNEFMMDFRKHEKERLKARDDKVRVLVSLGHLSGDLFECSLRPHNLNA